MSEPAAAPAVDEGGVRGCAMRAVALGLGLALAGGLLEFALRLVAQPPPKQTRVVEEYRVPPSTPHYRKVDHPAEDARPFRIWAVGDSFTWGDGVYAPDAWPRRLEFLLESLDPSVDVELSVISRPGWNTEQEWMALERRLEERDLEAEPIDLIVLAYCLNDAETRQREGLEDIDEPLDFRRPANFVGHHLFNHSRLFKALWMRWETWRQRRALRHYYPELYRREGWELTKHALQLFRKTSVELEIPLAVAVFPVFDQAIDEGYDYAAVHQQVMTALIERGLPAVDLRHAYRGIDPVRLAVDPFSDPHPNEFAHRIAAQAIARFLVGEGLTPLAAQSAEPLALSSPRPRGRPE